ncbi:hypothetical protein K7432_003362 [Basidiobolus ranarum]|uniref:Yeast cell wall synthesis Kre9/Knh1-like N-terminal domain-containing protein n=1 Tax=Basidiobolus ranarum TaxID=34480 RepID=A0ABR2X047_9FUNG
MLRQTANLLIASTLLGYVVVDAKLYITSPVKTTWKTGTKETITWENYGSGEMPKTFNLNLMDGNDKDLQFVELVAANIDSDKGSYEWTLPANLTTGQYALQAVSQDMSPIYTDKFDIIGTSDKHTSEVTTATKTSKSEVSSHVSDASKSKDARPSKSTDKDAHASKETHASKPTDASKDDSKTTDKSKDAHDSKTTDKSKDSHASKPTHASKDVQHNMKNDKASSDASDASSKSDSSSSSSTSTSASTTPSHHNGSNAITLPLVVVSILAFASSYITLA